MSLVKSVSIFHTSIKENERQERLAGNEAAARWWADRDAEVQEALQAANQAAMQHLQDWAQTRTGSGVARVSDEDTVKFEPTGLVVSSWLQGTSRDGDPQDHIHNQIARMTRTDADGKWRTVDTAGLRAQLGAVRATFGAHLRSEMTQQVRRRVGAAQGRRRLRAEGDHARADREVLDAHAGHRRRDQEARRSLEGPARRPGARPPPAALHPARGHDGQPPGQGRRPGRLGQASSRRRRPRWEAIDGTRLRDVAGKVSNLRGPGAPRATAQPGAGPSADAQMRVMQTALARVQEHHSTWIRADLMREIADSMPPEANAMAPADSVALVNRLTDRALAGEAGQVMSLDAPEYPQVPGYLRRELDGKSIYTRPGTTKYATSVQIAREKELLEATAKEGAPHLTREESAWLLGAKAEELEAAALAEGERADQAAFQRSHPGPGCRAAPGDDQRPHRLRHGRASRDRQDATWQRWPRGCGRTPERVTSSCWRRARQLPTSCAR